MLGISHSLPQDDQRDDLVLLHLIWEHPNKVVGGLGIAGAGLFDTLRNEDNVKLHVIAPSDAIQISLVPRDSYHVDINIEDTSRLQEAVLTQQTIEGVEGAVADFAREVRKACLTHPELGSCKIIHAHDWMTAAAGVSVKLSQGIPLILHVHSTQIDREGIHAKGAVYQHEKWAMQQSDVIIAVSDYTKRIIIDHYGISAEKIRVVRNASSADDRNVSVRNEPKKPIVMFAGRLVMQKHPEAAVEIMTGALKKLRYARGVIAGGGEKLGVIRELVKFKGMEDRIEVLGNVPQKNMHDIYATAAVLILPSISEPFGLVALEAARAGVAVMLSDRCGAGEVLKSAKVIGPYQTNVWIENLVELLANTPLREAQVSQQFSEIEDCKWRNAGAEVLSIVNELMNGASS